MVTWEWAKDTANIRTKLEKQGNDLKNIPVIIEGCRLIGGDLLIYLRPGIYPKDNYELKANKDCRSCGGHGWIRYQLDQDDIKSAPCHECFPETAAKSEWLRR